MRTRREELGRHYGRDDSPILIIQASAHVVAWMVAHRESATLAEQFIRELDEAGTPG